MPDPIQPVSSAERKHHLDALRGAALLGVLMVNLLDGFRVSLFTKILTFHTHPGWANHAVDILAAWIFEFKAISLFSLLLGVGMGIQSERTSARGVSTARFLVRRFAALLAIGICHMLLIWNGDILALYAVCGLLLIPFVSLSTRRLAALGVAIIALSPYMPFFGSFFPTEASMRAHAAIAARVYATGSFSEIMALRKSETVEFILPLLLNSFPRTVGLMLLGIAAWRSGILQQPGEHRKLLMVILVAAGGLGALTTTLHVWSKETGSSPPSALDLLYPYSPVLLACAYGACLLLWMRPMRMLAAAGRMALTNYLAQSVIFSLLFYGYGFGLFGKLGPAAAALIGLTVYAAQLTASQWWLERFPFGPVEIVWRWFTYGPPKPSRD